MRGVYTANIVISSLSTAKTLMLIQAPSTAVLEILSVNVSNATADSADQLQVGLFRVTTYGSPSGTSVTPEKHENLDSSSAATVNGNLTVEPSAYSTNPYDRQGVSNIGGYFYTPTPEERPVVAPSGAIGLRLLTSPSSAFDAVAQIVYREIG